MIEEIKKELSKYIISFNDNYNFHKRSTLGQYPLPNGFLSYRNIPKDSPFLDYKNQNGVVLYLNWNPISTTIYDILKKSK